jgi:hypothetical protein
LSNVKGRRGNETRSREVSIGLNEMVGEGYSGRCLECGTEPYSRRRHCSLSGQYFDVQNARESMVTGTKGWDRRPSEERFGSLQVVRLLILQRAVPKGVKSSSDHRIGGGPHPQSAEAFNPCPMSRSWQPNSQPIYSSSTRG